MTSKNNINQQLLNKEKQLELDRVKIDDILIGMRRSERLEILNIGAYT